MNRVNLELLDKQKELLDEKQKFLKQYGLDDESIKEFRSEIKKVSREEADILGERMNHILYKEVYESGPNNISFDEKMYNEMLSLILNGANVNYMNSYGKTALMYVLWCLEYTTLLIKAGANINVSTPYGETPIIIAAKAEYVELLKILILFGGNVNIENYFGQDALDCAKDWGNEECIKILEAAKEGRDIITEDDIKSDKKVFSSEILEENIITDKSTSKVLSELTDEELLQEAEDKLHEITSNPLTRKRSK